MHRTFPSQTCHCFPVLWDSMPKKARMGHKGVVYCFGAQCLGFHGEGWSGFAAGDLMAGSMVDGPCWPVEGHPLGMVAVVFSGFPYSGSRQELYHFFISLSPKAHRMKSSKFYLSKSKWIPSKVPLYFRMEAMGTFQKHMEKLDMNLWLR